MKKINTNHDNKDRIICVSETGKHKFYFQPVGTKERLWLFDTKNFSGNVKINKILDRIPAQVEYVLRERDEFVQMPCITAKAHNHNYDFDRAA